MADIEELLTDTPLRLAPAAAIRARGDRRRTRRRTAVAAVAVAAAGAMGFGVWAGLGLPEGSGGGTEVASTGPNPFMSDGVVQTPDPSELPGNEVLHWKGVDPATDFPLETAPLPQVGLDTACGLWSGDADKPEQQFTNIYTGRNDARARYRVSQYATRAAAETAVKDLDTALADCGVEKAEGEPDGTYTGVARGTAAQLVVTVKSWGAWVAVQETQVVPVQ
ncbi:MULTISPECIES: hypothetical protein [unclassified Streptomyces]|uniref:hypothetical protein n=1 Tax=unclassified Streptomyces TaxID=2593676 RepID=UPI00081E697F|nr:MULTISPECIES: hypothetical protein [unclassified Streptomyces]MYR97427.1 hypothetical protein [Streptomyces sp. SID4937]SCE25240.1 hypothetical protein GA0115243_109392 [Streptomyces sp. ScaeMP-e83]